MKNPKYSVRAIIFFCATLIAVAVCFFLQILDFGDLQRNIPSHFNAQGVADDYMSAKGFLTFIFGVYFFMIFLLSGVMIIVHEKGNSAPKTDLEKWLCDKLKRVEFLKKITLLDAITLTILSTSAFIYFINDSILRYESTKEFSALPVDISLAAMIAVILIFSISRAIPSSR